jgi:hypothetical protein
MGRKSRGERLGGGDDRLSIVNPPDFAAPVHRLVRRVRVLEAAALRLCRYPPVDRLIPFRPGVWGRWCEHGSPRCIAISVIGRGLV